jgi:hypothetical protein
MFSTLHHLLFCFEKCLGQEFFGSFAISTIQVLKRSYSEIPTRFLTPYREFEQRPHTPHWRQLDSSSRYGVRKYSRVTSTLTDRCFIPNCLILKLNTFANFERPSKIDLSIRNFFLAGLEVMLTFSAIFCYL